jgi:uncharacterized protein (DUF2236 family)
MQWLTFGDTDQVVAAAARINAIHDRVNGTILDGAAGRYSAHDPALQRWVHATLLESILGAYEQFVGPLTRDERDRYCAEAAIMEPLLGMPAGWLPRNSVQLDACMRDMLASGGIAVSATSRALARALLFPRHGYLAWPVVRAMQRLTIGSLPPAIRGAYGFTWDARDAKSCARWTSLIRVAIGCLPAFAREWPMARRKDFAPGAVRASAAEGEPNELMS